MGLKDIFPNVKKPVIGMIHLAPLPGSFTYKGQSINSIKEHALEDAKILAEAGFDGFLMQNANDRPASTSIELCPEKIAYMSVIGAEIHKEYPHIPIGVNVTYNIPKAAIAIAHAIGGAFVRMEYVYMGVAVTPYGIMQGCSYEATQFLRHIEAKDIQIFADIYEARTIPLGQLPIEEAAIFALIAGQASAVIITGRTVDESINLIKTVKGAYPKADVILGGGSTRESIKEIIRHADSILVGRPVKEEGRVWDKVSSSKAKEFMEEVSRAREEMER